MLNQQIVNLFLLMQEIIQLRGYCRKLFTLLAIRYRSDRISETKKRIEDAIPNRIKYFDEQNFNMYPIQ